MPLLLGRDIRFHKWDRESASAKFEIIESKAVDEFLKDKEFMEFLQDPINPKGKFENGGCRLNVSLKAEDGKNFLIISRQLGPNTFIQAADYDLMFLLNAYVMPYSKDCDNLGNYCDWADMAGAHGKDPEELELPTIKKDQPRAEKYLKIREAFVAELAKQAAAKKATVSENTDAADASAGSTSMKKASA